MNRSYTFMIIQQGLKKRLFELSL